MNLSSEIEGMKNKKLLLLPLAVAGTGIVILGAMNPGNSAQTQSDSAVTSLRTRHYKTSLSEAYKTVLEVVPQLRTYGKMWRVVSHQENEVRADVPVFLFTDDLVITLKEVPDGVTLDVKSTSRLGKGDFGENRRHILQLLAVLDENLPLAN